MESVVIKNGLIVTADDTFQGNILISGEVITGIGPDPGPPEARVIDATDCYVMPGGVDVHTHLNLTAGGVTVGDGFFVGTAAAAFGGTTCIIEHPGFGPPGCSLLHQVKSYQAQADGQAVVDYGLHAVFQHVDEAVLDQMDRLDPMGVISAKIYLTYDGRLNDLDILKVLARTRQTGVLATFHAENDAIIRFLQRQFRAQGKLTPEYHPLSRPQISEVEAIQRILYLAEAAGGAPVYIVHLSTALGLQAIEDGRQRGLRVYAEVCPQHLLLDDSCYQAPDGEGLKFVMAPPARKPADCNALWQGLGSGAVDLVATDHCAFTFEEKLARGRGDFSKCPGGIPGVETRLPLIFSEGVRRGRLSLNRFVDVVSTAPAKRMGLYPRKGTLTPGADADVIVFDPGREKTVTPDHLYHNAEYSPYDGWRVRGWPQLTMVRGRVVMQQDRLTVKKGWGQYIDRRFPDRSGGEQEASP